MDIGVDELFTTARAVGQLACVQDCAGLGR